MRHNAIRIFLALLFSITAPAHAHSQTLSGSISGRVVTTDGKPVVAATVSIVELGVETRTDADGAFVFTRVPEGQYTISARRSGLRQAVMSRVSAGTQVGSIVMVQSPVTIGPVTVTAARSATETGSSVLPVSELSEDQLRRDATISIAHSLIRLPGVRSVSTGEQIGKPMIRGFYGSRVLTMQNGSRLEDYSWSEEDAPSVDARLAQRVEVIRGPASVLYGSDAIGGVVNVIPQDLPVATEGRGFHRIGGEIYGASNNLETGGTLNVEGANGRLGWRATGIGRFAQSYGTPAGEVGHTGFFSVNGEAAAILRGTRSNTSLRFSHYGGEFKLLEARGPGSGSAQGNTEEGPERKLADERIQLVNDYSLPGIRLETRAQFQRHSLVEVSDDLCAIQPAACSSLPAGAPTEQTAFDLLLNTGTLDVLAHHSIGGNISGVAGVSGMYQSNDSRGPIFLIPSATINSGAAFLFEEATLGRLGVAVGGRVDARSLSADANTSLGLNSSDNRDWTEPSGNAGLVLHLTPELALTGNAGLAWRAPTLFELYANGPHLAEARYEIGDASLNAEHARNLDAGVRWRSSRLVAEVNAFRNRIADFIYITPTSEFNGGLRVYRHLQADALMTGGEMSAQVEVIPNVLLRARHDYVRGTNEETGNPLPLMPPPRTAFGAEYHSSSAANAFIGAEVENLARQKRPDPSDVVTAGYTLLNVDAGIDYRLFGRTTRVDIGVRNALNREYRSFLSRYKEFALEPGRNVVLRFSTTP